MMGIGRFWRTAGRVALTASLCAAFGCATGTQDLGKYLPAVAALAGGAGGYALGKDEKPETMALYMAGGAAGAYVIAELIRGKVRDTMVKEFNAGYALGTSNAAKNQYWIIQRRQMEDDAWGAGEEPGYKYFAFPGPPVDPTRQVIYTPHDIVVRGLSR